MLVNWPDEYDEFLMTHVINYKKELVAELKDRYRIIDQRYNTKSMTHPITVEEFYVAFSTVMSRMISCDMPNSGPEWFDKNADDICSELVPIFDLFNHKKNPNCDFFVRTNGVIQMVSNQRVSPNNELFIHYGQGSNKNFIFTYIVRHR